jgi:hypothetical protein
MQKCSKMRQTSLTILAQIILTICQGKFTKFPHLKTTNGLTDAESSLKILTNNNKMHEPQLLSNTDGLFPF